MAVDSAGNVYVADGGNNRVRKVSPDGTTVTVAGTGAGTFADGNGCVAKFQWPASVALRNNKLFVADQDNSRVRVVQLP